ncbi:SMP-30/gluconolactonase/LRE family protein [Sphingomonas sp. G-3-2-10]|uniref:SMP-30/gluconolactonase/LRE family protein n=1 Tax=Sphingomonas sp. G-3-2-10 TaxID=2728838 RepID=UPI00146C30B0|nr:SMP-30/gluconolactonase/LRE family protein [Sphingomonas sp. G-3-2-10]NML07813.1 SMP-30/gluconolactonase/LRE family protein [Sphingomonas sp. G-3-2-10]
MSDVAVIARDRRDRLGEGPLWSARENALYWVDILGRRVNRLSLADRSVTSFEQPAYAAWIIEREAGGLVAGIGLDIVRLDLPANTRETIGSVDKGIAGNRLNDAKADRQGRIWAGTMPAACDKPSGAFYRIDPDGIIVRADAPYTIANGPAIDPEGHFLLHTDTALATIFRFDIHDDGSLGQRRPFITFERGWGNPDGMTFDADGGLWVACWGGGCVTRFTPEGVRDRSIALPASQITSCAFAGPALDRMFVTSAGDGVKEPLGGALFEIDPGQRGRTPEMYRG